MAAKLARISLTRLYVFIHTQEQEAQEAQQRLEEQMALSLQKEEEARELQNKLEEAKQEMEEKQRALIEAQVSVKTGHICKRDVFAAFRFYLQEILSKWCHCLASLVVKDYCITVGFFFLLSDRPLEFTRMSKSLRLSWFKLSHPSTREKKSRRCARTTMMNMRNKCQAAWKLVSTVLQSRDAYG